MLSGPASDRGATMTEPPQDHQRPPTPGPRQPVGPPQPADPFDRPYAAPQSGPGPYGPREAERSQPGVAGPPSGPSGQPSGAPGQPGRKSRVGLIAGATVLLLVAVAVVLALTLGKTLLDRAAVQRDVAAQFEAREGVAIDLDCPLDMEVEDGATYECRGTTDDGEDVTLRIRIDDADDARYSWSEP
jgi:uncharacterized protein DUF4333